ncbi:MULTISPECIES: Cu(I)-responsive transcriptional regulator [Methylobacteriaceae]|uniref:Cu(I)-responsive transcriptional regulator n=1 Tax=Methylobacteriaceae TaxID=119045 RepID=UPI000CDA748C|nr:MULTISPECIES: Cu(I)-responsive transcriptional regulator [Methylobacteriaceae]MCP1549403.1 MerR family gold-responsive transcriptional activator of gol and ges genes [Methylorubrum zatmanii]MCP1553984.1 MerR family gold-responsive transcriptional activator of gol and ges genes [Methylorubrum extorquens]MCP1579705.1 MerR family gold-responsive transcriptional activator of gol and ges genes [Methylorubrum extorquens]POR41055.1 Cu(I)-responsive transcriptional regulator [Methylobacterium sp. V2
MNIGEASRASGVSAKMIRHYESIGLVPPADRRDSGYRDYGTADLHRLGFVRHARDLGFSLDRIRVLLGLWSDPDRSNADVKAIARAHVKELEQRARQLNEMADALRSLADACDGDGRPDCPIIASLETGADVSASRPGASPGPARPPTPRRKAVAKR